MSSYLITGGAGCIGSHLLEHLIKEGHKVTVIDKLVYPDQSKYILTSLLKNYPQVGFYNFDLADFNQTLDFFVNHSFDGVFHLAALPSHRIAMSYPHEYFESDLHATVNILESLRKVCPKTPLVFSSTNKVYDDREVVVSETSQLDPKGPYALSKIQSEQWCQFYSSRFNLKIAACRLFHVIGSRMQPNRETNVFTRSILEETPVHLHGKFQKDGTFQSAYFGYTHVLDVAEGLKAVMDNTKKLDKFEVYNIGSNKKIFVSEILAAISNKLGKQVQVVNTAIMDHESMGCVADTTKLESLGWKSQNNAMQGLVEYVDWYLEFTGQVDSFTNHKKGKFSGVLF